MRTIRDKAEALRAYGKQAGLGLEMQNTAAEIKIRVEEKCETLLDDMQKSHAIEC